MKSERIIINSDALVWLKKQKDNSVPNFVTGICDLGETHMSFDKYISFFKEVTQLICKKLHRKGYAIFIQTDRKYNRSWISKSTIITNIALSLGMKQIWHKIVLHREVNRTDLHRPTYAHMLCYSYDGSTGAAFPDVLPVSDKLYKNGTPLNAAEQSIIFIKKNNKYNTSIVDPFVGQGTIPALANKHGLNSLGIDIDKEQVEKAKVLRLE